MSTTFPGRERARPDWLREHPRAWIAAVTTVCFGAFMGQLDASVIALAYRSIGTTFHAGLASVQWISLTYLITLAMLLVPVGRISDRLGRKRVYLWGFALFTAASAGCAVAPTLAVVVALRSVQGAGAAMLQANSVALVSTSAPAGRLRMALGLQASAQAMGLAVGPTLGGLIVQTVGWRWIFAANVPIGLIAVAAGRYLLPRTRIVDQAPAGLGETLRQRGVIRGLAGASLAYLLLFGPIVLVPAVLQAGGVAPLHAGLLVATLPMGFAAGAVLAGRLLPRGWGKQIRTRLGLLLAGVGLGMLLAAGIHPVSCVGALTLTGLGLGLYVPTNNAVIMTATPRRSAALTGGLISAGRAVGTAAGTAIVTFTLAISTTGSLALGALLALMAVTIAVAAGSHPPARTR